MNSKPLHSYPEPTQVALLKKQIAGVEAARVAAVQFAAAETRRADGAEHEVRSLTLEMGRMRQQLARASVELASLKGRGE